MGKAKTKCQTGRNSIKYNTIEDEENLHLGKYRKKIIFFLFLGFIYTNALNFMKFEIYLNMVNPALFDVINLFL